MKFAEARFGLAAARFIGTRTTRLVAAGLSIRSQKVMLHSGNMALLCAAVLILPLAALPQAAPPFQSAESANHPELLFVQAASVKAGRLSERFPQGSRIVRLKMGSSEPANLTPNFFGAADPRISFDGSKVLFAGKKDDVATWQVWEMNTDGTGQRQVTHCDGDCLAPAYLPRDEIAFSGEVQDAGGSRVYQIYVSRLDGSNAHPITFGPGDYELETVLQNGLILASARSPLQARGKSESSRNLYTLRYDGSGLAAFRCDHQPPAIRSQAEELDDGSVVFVKNRVLGPKRGAIWLRSDVAPCTIQLWAL